MTIAEINKLKKRLVDAEAALEQSKVMAGAEAKIIEPDEEEPVGEPVKPAYIPAAKRGRPPNTN